MATKPLKKTKAAERDPNDNAVAAWEKANRKQIKAISRKRTPTLRAAMSKTSICKNF